MMNLLTRLLAALARRLPPRRLEALVLRMLRARLAGLPPEDALRLLFGIEERIYPLLGGLAVAFGGGTHTKHRHTRYHDFFIDRIQAGERVLDVGCGGGELACDIAQRAGAQVLGIDLEPGNIAKAQRRPAMETVAFKVGDALADLPDERFAVVVLSNVLEHLPDRPQVLKRLNDSAQPRRFLIRVPLFERDWRVPLRRELGLEWRLDPTHETEYTLESFAGEMVAAGLTVTHQEVRWGEIWAQAEPVQIGSS